MQITPAILPENVEQLVEKLFILEGVCERVQVDLCDGVFGLEKTWLPYQGEPLPEGFLYEFDLMVVDWKKYLIRVIELGASRVIMHIDTFTDNDIDEMLNIFMLHKISLGVSVSNDKSLDDFSFKVNRIALHYPKLFIQVMGIKNIGAQGQPFDESVLGRISYLKEECKNIDIQVDGSMNSETILKVKNAGATCAVVGSYLFKQGTSRKEVKKTLDELVESFR